MADMISARSYSPCLTKIEYLLEDAYLFGISIKFNLYMIQEAALEKCSKNITMLECCNRDILKKMS